MPLILIPLIPVAGLIGYATGRNDPEGNVAKDVASAVPWLLSTLLGSSRSK